MKKLLQFFLISLTIVGCSSMQLEAVSSSQDETQRILALGLTHAENLIEAKKLKDNHTVSVVTGQLMKAEDERIQAVIDAEKIAEYSQMINVSDDNSKFTAPKISESIKIGVLDDEYDYQDYFLQGLKDNNSLIQHQLHLSLKYNWRERRNYSHANVCDKWQRCDDGKKIDVAFSSANASGCSPSTSTCNYTEVMELNLTDDILRGNMDSGLTLRLFSKKETSKVNISSAYIKAYLKAIE
tara:strand:- start:112 stop:831 length:720 start_codon:yes stop_codon:yes gene_type:complete